MFKRILLSLLLIPSIALAAGGQDKLLLNDNGNVVVGTTSATGDFRVIHNGVVVLTSVAGGVDLGGVATFDSGGLNVAPAGSAAAPAITLGGTQTGLYEVSGDLGLTANGFTIALGDTNNFSFATNIIATGEVELQQASTSSGVLCTKLDGDIGQCTSAVGSGGTCTCS